MAVGDSENGMVTGVVCDVLPRITNGPEQVTEQVIQSAQSMTYFLLVTRPASLCVRVCARASKQARERLRAHVPRSVFLLDLHSVFLLVF